MKLLLGSLLVVALFITESQSYGKRGESTVLNPGELLKCFDRRLVAHFSDGDEWSHPGVCQKITCSISKPDQNKRRSALIEYTDCIHADYVDPNSNCSVVTPSIHAVYPHCCTKMHCVNNNL